MIEKEVVNNQIGIYWDVQGCTGYTFLSDLFTLISNSTGFPIIPDYARQGLLLAR